MKAVELTSRELEVLVKVSESGEGYILEDISSSLKSTPTAISKILNSLHDKGLIIMYKGSFRKKKFESQFDGELTEAGLHEVENSKVNNEQEVKQSKNMATKKAKTVKVEDSKSVNNAVDNFDTPVMDERILKLNELKAVKMANLSKSKRPAAKEAKELATYILNNWDDEFELAKVLNAETIHEDLRAILASRLENFADAKKAVDEALKDGPIVGKTPKTEKKAKVTKTQKELVDKATKGGKATVEVEVGAGKSGKAKNADSKKAEPKAKEEKQPKEKKAETARKVGDVHPNHPTWVWTEYKPGKFDWRTNPADKKQGQRTDKATTSEKKSEPKKAAVSKKAVAKETNKKVAKGGKVEKEAPKKDEKRELTIDEFVALPTKSAKTNKKPSEAQKDALKLIMKGYRITSDKKFFENAEGDKKACNWDSVTALFKRYGMDYVPEGLVK